MCFIIFDYFKILENILFIINEFSKILPFKGLRQYRTHWINFPFQIIAAVIPFMHYCMYIITEKHAIKCISIINQTRKYFLLLPIKIFDTCVHVR